MCLNGRQAALAVHRHKGHVSPDPRGKIKMSNNLKHVLIVYVWETGGRSVADGGGRVTDKDFFLVE